MNGMFYLNMGACGVIFVWATWCALSRRVRDGVLGKVMFAVAALAALAVILGPQGGYHGPRTAEVTLNVAMALLGVRHAAIRYLWPRVVRAVRCAACPNRDI